MVRRLPSRQRGIGYLLLLFIVAAMGGLLAGAGEVWQTAVQRERERELLFVGQQIRDAIVAYHSRSPGALKEYPKSLADLLKDKRFPVTVRYLRRIYRDPMTNSTEWGLVKLGDGIIGVYSLSPGMPLKQDNFPIGLEAFIGRASYREWVFAGS